MKNKFAWIVVGVLAVGMLAAGFAGETDVAALLQKTDDLNDANDYDAALETALKAYQLEPENAEVLWRAARAYFNVADQAPDDEQLQIDNMYPGFEMAKTCVELAPDIAEGHQYYAILIGRIGEIEGTKQKIENSYDVREHTLIAIDLDPENDSNYHVMGRWHFALADLSWVERKVASIIYATPPEASFEEAAEYFQMANKLAGGDVRHLLWMGKSYIELDKEAEAKKALEACLAIAPETDAERGMHSEAKELLADL